MSDHKKKAGSSAVNTKHILIIAAVVIALAAVVLILILSEKKPENSEGTTDTAQTQPATQPASQPDTQPTSTPTTEPQILPTVEIVERAEGTYEQWLAAAAVVGLSMEYEDFVPLGIYTGTDTALSDRAQSGGVYIHFISGGEERLLFSAPLEGERTDAAGTTDLYIKELGYNTFDLIDLGSTQLESMEQIAFEDLSVYIEQSLLVSLYGR